MGFFRTQPKSPIKSKLSVDYTLLQGSYNQPIVALGLMPIRTHPGVYMLVNDSQGFKIDTHGIMYINETPASILFEYEIDCVVTDQTPLIDNGTGVQFEIVLIDGNQNVVSVITELHVYSRQFTRDNRLIKVGAFLPVKIYKDLTIGMRILTNEANIGMGRIMCKTRLYPDDTSMIIEEIK